MLLKLYKTFNQNINSAEENQQKILEELLRLLHLKSYEDFKKLPIANYELLKENQFYDQEKKADFYVRTSGTNSASKLIPISENYLNENHIEASKQSFYNMIIHHGMVKVLSGKNITLTGYEYESNHKNKQVLDISALLFNSRPPLFKFISKPVNLYKTWEEKLIFFKENYDSYKDYCSISGVPTWIISLFSHLENEFNKPIKELLPNLKYIVHGGVDFKNYFNIFNNCFDDRTLQFYEIYNSTEAFIGFQLEPNNSDLLLSTNTGNFYEFSKNDEIIPVSELKKDTYELIISNKDGLIRYATGDLIEIVSLNPLLFRFKGRVSEYINAFGEDLIIDQTNKALTSVSNEMNIEIYEYFVVPSLITPQEKGYHEWFIFTDEIPNQENQLKITTLIDKKLQKLNNNYRQKRNKSLAIKMPKIHFLKTEMYKKILKQHNKQEGGQAKVKRLYNDREIIKTLNLR